MKRYVQVHASDGGHRYTVWFFPGKLHDGRSAAVRTYDILTHAVVDIQNWVREGELPDHVAAAEPS